MSTPPTPSGYLAFLRDEVGISAADLPDDSPWITGTFDMAIAVVNDLLALVQNPFYPLAVYNFATDRLLNYAIDQPTRSFFKDMRSQLGLNSFAAGLVTSSSDAGTSQSLQVIDAAKGMTITQLQMAKTPYGRAYLGLAQSYGPTIWGLT